MKNSFRIPIFKSQRNSLAVDLMLDAKLAAKSANESRKISDFIEQYNIVLDCFKKLSDMNGKVDSVKGNLTGEYFRLVSEFQKHLHDSISRSGDNIISNRKGIYKYDDDYIRQCILEFKSDIEKYSYKFDEENKKFADANFRYVCHECKMESILYQQRAHSINIDEIIQEEKKWRTHQCSPRTLDLELSKIDGMSGHEFEYWCANLLRKNGFQSVEVTPGSGDQGVDITAEKEGIKYAIQCKCYSSDLGNSPIQEVNAGKMIYHCHIGVVMTNQYFTAGAKQAADATGVLLWGRNKLVQMMQTSIDDWGVL